MEMWHLENAYIIGYSSSKFGAHSTLEKEQKREKLGREIRVRLGKALNAK